LTRPQAEVDAAMGLVRAGLNDCQVARRLRIPRGTIRDWRLYGVPNKRGRSSGCFRCEGDASLRSEVYAYLLGLYLGDGCISACPRDVFKLRIVLDARYPGIIAECERAISSVLIDRVLRAARVKKIGCVEVSSYWKHWPCLFPQHGPGAKHRRPIALAPWQEKIVATHPAWLLRGLIQSDGCRDANFVKGRSYPRYAFTNSSQDIRRIFSGTCDAYGIHWTKPSWRTISISRRADVARLDEVIGPKA
jgi:hypothetical protein